MSLTFTHHRQLKAVGLLLVITIIAAVLRILFLDLAPNTFSTDEVSNGYDSYSILHTLRDRYGHFLPILLTGFNDSRESLYVFLSIPLIQLFGLNEFSVRLPSALAGTLTVPVLYYLAQECFQNKKISLTAAFLFAISPWSIFYSRLTFHANLLPLFFCLGLLFFLKSFRKPNYLLLSSFIFGLNLYTYASARAFIPLFMLGLLIIFWQELWKTKTQTILAIAIFLAIFLFFLSLWLAPGGMARVEETGIETNILRLLVNYISYFEPIFLFLHGDWNERRSVTTWGVGELHLFELVTVILGILTLKKKANRVSKIFFLWLFLYPIPAALTEPQHSIRAIVGIPLFSLLSACGFWQIPKLLKSARKKIFNFLAPLIITISLIFFGQAYFDFSQYKIPNTSAGHWQYGMKQALTYAENNNYSCVFMSNSFKRVNMYIIFYTKYPPAKYQLAPVNPEMQYFTQDYRLEKYTITDVTQPKTFSDKCLFIIKPEELEKLSQIYPNWQELQTIKTPEPDRQEKIKLIEVISADK
jgi:4-amino-4-deoxy-L-arabinose transferase-like glycosyltransferase